MQNSNVDEDNDYSALIGANVVTDADADAIANANTVANRRLRIMTPFLHINQYMYLKSITY